jgi:hypothetical protein
MTRRSRNGVCACEACGESFTPTRSDGRYCSSPCRQRAYRRRTQSRVLDLAKPSSQGNGAGPPRLTAEMRQLLREAIDRRRRELLNTVDADQVAADRALFADDGVTV